MAAVIPKVSKLSSFVTRILGCNPSPMTLQGTNTYLLGTGRRRLLVDAGEPNVPDYIDSLQTTLAAEGCEVSDLIVTHWHRDHVGGVPDVLKLSESRPRVHKFPRSDGPETNIGQVDMVPLRDGQVFEVEGGSVTIHHTPGHTQDHVVLYIQNSGALLSADCILGEGTAVFEDLHSYMLSLRKILDLKPSVIYPAHGPVVQDPIAKIEYYIKHRTAREDQILAALVASPEQTPADLVKTIYKDTPANLHGAARVNVTHHLSKLLKEERVENMDGGRWRIKK